MIPRMAGGKRENVIETQEWSPRGDPMLALLPAERPWAFDRLPFEEQQWRARVFFATWITTGGMMYAWAEALRDDEDTPEVKAWVLWALTDEVILDGLRSRNQQRPS